jgi:hypothetical protein
MAHLFDEHSHLLEAEAAATVLRRDHHPQVSSFRQLLPQFVCEHTLAGLRQPVGTVVFLRHLLDEVADHRLLSRRFEHHKSPSAWP